MDRMQLIFACRYNVLFYRDQRHTATARVINHILSLCLKQLCQWHTTGLKHGQMPEHLLQNGQHPLANADRCQPSCNHQVQNQWYSKSHSWRKKCPGILSYSQTMHFIFTCMTSHTRQTAIPKDGSSFAQRGCSSCFSVKPCHSQAKWISHTGQAITVWKMSKCRENPVETQQTRIKIHVCRPATKDCSKRVST